MSSNANSQCRVFISYKRDVDPDQMIARELLLALGKHHKVFIDQVMTVGTDWPQRIREEIAQSDFLILLLSAHAAESEMVEAEVRTAHELALQQDGRPRILPVRLAYRDPFRYPLNFYLDRINWVVWDEPLDTPRLVDELLRAVNGASLDVSSGGQNAAVLVPSPASVEIPAPLPSAQREMPEGTMDPDSPFYVERPADVVARDSIGQSGVTITIKGPRQMGKSSLLMRTIEAARAAGKHVAYLDFQLFDHGALTNADRFYPEFCTWLTDELGLDNRVPEYFAVDLGHNQRCTRYVSRYLLKELASPLVLAMDEVEMVFDSSFRSDFFGMLRSWHNSRQPATPVWKQLDLVLVTSTEPYQLIENLNQSPFNVGEVLDLSDFTPAQVADLNRRYGAPFRPDEEARLMELLHGHPYLTRRSLYLAATGRISASDLFARAADDRGPFGDHLRYHLFRLADRPALVRGMLESIRDRVCSDELVVFRLQGAGLLRREGRSVLPRCQLYAEYFRERLRA